ncbi:tRNA wybutosine-synthesizing protein 2/3/4 isoform X2 [Aristolochia californica]|uniref:tRNA wybutosine-synthesizing protein 2/3/4 isoform X2 n=1 Tax=Aristolochia californica TaxID=171875 RepID=UPI0035D95914
MRHLWSHVTWVLSSYIYFAATAARRRRRRGEGRRGYLSDAATRRAMEFEERKSKVLASLSSIDYTDKSPKGSLDLPIVSLIDSINQNPSYYTTSSCSGRISILSQPLNPSSISKKKARGGSWLYITHDPADSNTVLDILFGVSDSSPIASGDLVFRFEPFIVAVECKDVSSAQELVSTAIACGYRESGITSLHKRIMVAIRCSIRLEVPLGEIGNIMVSPKYLEYLIGIANEKMVANRRRTDGFLQVLQSKALLEPKELSVKKQNCSVKGASSFISQANGLCDVVEATFEKDNLSCATDHTKFGTICDNGKDECDTYSARLNIKEDNGSDCSCKNPASDVNDPSLGGVRDINSKNTNQDSHSGVSEDAESCLSIKMTVNGEPIAKLFLWGHSACTVKIGCQRQILVFGGFGGLGRHARRNDTLILDPLSGVLRASNAERSPSSRLGHTSSAVGEHVFVIGGRGDPTKILSDVWVLNAAKGEWKLLDCTGSEFNRRHRHAAATVGSKIYVFGGLNHETIYSCMHFLDTETLQWNKISNEGKEWPCARHSHSLVAKGMQLFMFGGFDGEKALGDLYSFDVGTCAWKKEKTTGMAPYARFSHCMFLYNDHLGIIGGCPIKQYCQEMALLNLSSRVWRHVKIESISKDLFVRGTTSVFGDNVFLIGGGASCYAFGTKFNEPTKINLCPLISFDKIPLEMKEQPMVQDKEVVESNGNAIDGKPFVLQLERKFGKVGKDILKRFGWLDLGRKVHCSQDGLYICFPITEGSYSFLQRKVFESLGVPGISEQLIRKDISINEISVSEASNTLLACGGSVRIDDVICIKQPPKSPHKMLKEAVSSLLEHKGLPRQLLEQLPTRVELSQMQQGTVLWRSLWEIMVGYLIMKMECPIPLMPQSACFPLEISLRRFAWAVWTVGMKLLWICLQGLDTLCCHF